MFTKLMKELGLPDSITSIILGFLVVIVGGLLVYNYISPQKNSQTSQNNTDLEKQEIKNNNFPKVHKVKPGESLWKIAEQNYGSGYNWIDIAKENKLSNPDKLLVDTELILPNVQVIKPAGDVSSTSVQVISYTVQPGDNLWKIAVNQLGDGYAWTRIVKENNLNNPNLIFAGNVLKITK